MSSDAMVVEDGVDETTPEPRPRSGWALVGIGFLLGLALGTVVSLPGPSTSSAEQSDSTVIPEEDLSPENSGIGEVVPGFPDTLVAISDGLGVGLPARSGLEHLLWPVRGASVTRTMPPGRDVVVDVTGDYYAMSTPLPDREGLLLSMGRINDVRPVRTGVTSYAWHASAGGTLAYTIDDDDGWHLYTTTPGSAPEEVDTSGYPRGTVVAWGDWGYVIQSSDDTVLLTASGEFKGIERGRAIASHPNGWNLVVGDRAKLVSSGGGIRLLDLAEHGGSLSAAAFSPDGRRVAVAGDRGLFVYVLDDEASVSLAAEASHWVIWSSDSRFVIASADSGIAIHDVETGESYQVLVGRNVVAALAVSISRP